MNEVDRKRKMKQELKTKGQKREETMITGKLVWGLFHKFGPSLVASFLGAFLDCHRDVNETPQSYIGRKL